MHTLYSRKDPIPSLYVKAAPNTFDIRAVFQQARAMTPCLLVFEDIDTVVTYATRSYFFNEVDGLENNDGILMVASTNHRKSRSSFVNMLGAFREFGTKRIVLTQCFYSISRPTRSRSFQTSFPLRQKVPVSPAFHRGAKSILRILAPQTEEQTER